MPYIKAKNGNVVEVSDLDLAERAKKDGHEAFETDPRKSKNAKKWDSEAEKADAPTDGDDK